MPYHAGEYNTHCDAGTEITDAAKCHAASAYLFLTTVEWSGDLGKAPKGCSRMANGGTSYFNSARFGVTNPTMRPVCKGPKVVFAVADAGTTCANAEAIANATTCGQAAASAGVGSRGSVLTVNLPDFPGGCYAGAAAFTTSPARPDPSTADVAADCKIIRHNSNPKITWKTGKVLLGDPPIYTGPAPAIDLPAVECLPGSCTLSDCYAAALADPECTFETPYDLAWEEPDPSSTRPYTSFYHPKRPINVWGKCTCFISTVKWELEGNMNLATPCDGPGCKNVYDCAAVSPPPPYTIGTPGSLCSDFGWEQVRDRYQDVYTGPSITDSDGIDHSDGLRRCDDALNYLNAILPGYPGHVRSSNAPGRMYNDRPIGCFYHERDDPWQDSGGVFGGFNRNSPHDPRSGDLVSGSDPPHYETRHAGMTPICYGAQRPPSCNRRARAPLRTAMPPLVCNHLDPCVHRALTVDR